MTSEKQRDLSILRPYNGSHRILPEGCPKILSTFSGDVSSLVTYSFNSLGFRGEEFEVTADRHIFVCGGSATLGLGLDYTDAWVSLFRRGFSALHEDVTINLQNFSSSGCSPGYIARTLIGQCARFRPTLALAELTGLHRAEILHEGRSYNIGPWCLLDSFDRGARADGHDHELRQMIRRKAKAYYELDDKLLSGQELLKNALLLQLFFQFNEIPFLIGLAESDAGELLDDPLLAPWIDSLDPERVFTIPHRDCNVDQSAAPGHPGPAASRAIAENFLSRYRDIYGLGLLSDKEQGTLSGVPGPQTSTSNKPVFPSWKKWSSKKSKNVNNEDSNVYPLY